MCLLVVLAPEAPAQRRGRRWPYYGYPPGYDWRWGPSPSWGPGIDHPYYQPWIPFPQARRNDPGSRFEAWMDEGFRAFRRGELKVARHRFEEARDLATERWGAESKQAVEASRALANLRDPEPEAGSETPAAPDAATAPDAASPSPASAPVTPGEAAPPGAPPLPEPSAEVADTLAKIRDRLAVGRRARER